MRKLFQLTVFTLFLCVPRLAHAQSTTVSGQVTDASSQAWLNATVTAQFVPNPLYPTLPQYSWTGGAFIQTVNGTLNATGGYSISVPSNTSITPVGSFWQFKFCPQATAPCFTTANVTVTGGTQTVNATPPAFTVSAGPGAVAYADSEVIATIGQTYFNSATTIYRVCQASPCSSNWFPVGGVANQAGIPIYNGPNIQYAAAYGVKAQGIRYTDCSFVNTSRIVNCGITPAENDVPFTASMLTTGPGGGGWLVFGTNGPPTTPLFTATAILPVGTITAVNSTTQIQVSLAATASCASVLNTDNCQLFIAPTDDSNGLLAAANAAFLSTTNGGSAQGNSGGKLILPQGYMWVSKSINNNLWGCNALGEANGTATGCFVEGAGLTTSVIVPSPSAGNYTTGGNTAAFFFDTVTRGSGWHYRHFSIDGMGQYALLSSPPNTALLLGQNSDAIDIGLFGWGTRGIVTSAGDAAEAVIDHCWINMGGGVDGVLAGSYTKITNSALFWPFGTGDALQSNGIHVTSLNNTYDFSSGTGAMVLVSGNDFTSTSDAWITPGAGTIALNVTAGSAHVAHGQFKNPQTGSIGIKNAGGTTVYLGDSQVLMNANSGQALNIAGTVIDTCGNNILTAAANTLTGVYVPCRTTNYGFNLSLPTVAGTGPCATITTQTGTIYWGSFKCTGTTGAATITITPGTTAANGFRCTASDITTVADTVTPTTPGAPTTTCTLSAAAIAANDVVTFDLTPF